MTEKECLAAGIAVSLFAHFALLIAPRPPEPEPSFTTVVQMDMASPAVATSREKGIGIAAASPRDMDKADAADRKRQAFLRYLDDIDEAVHARASGRRRNRAHRRCPNICSPSGPTGRSPIPCSAHPQARRSSTPRRAGPSSPPAAKCAAPPSSERNPSPSFCTSNTNTASADRATARQSSRIARKGQGGVDGVMPFSGALQRGRPGPFPGPATGGCRDESGSAPSLPDGAFRSTG